MVPVLPSDTAIEGSWAAAIEVHTTLASAVLIAMAK
jgi:hypothetical protein